MLEKGVKWLNIIFNMYKGCLIYASLEYLIYQKAISLCVLFICLVDRLPQRETLIKLSRLERIDKNFFFVAKSGSQKSRSERDKNGEW